MKNKAKTQRKVKTVQTWMNKLEKNKNTTLWEHYGLTVWQLCLTSETIHLGTSQLSDMPSTFTELHGWEKVKPKSQQEGNPLPTNRPPKGTSEDLRQSPGDLFEKSSKSFFTRPIFYAPRAPLKSACCSGFLLPLRVQIWMATSTSCASVISFTTCS